MSDHGFGDILKAWENNLDKKVAKKSESTFEKLIDSYSPDEKILKEKERNETPGSPAVNWKHLPIDAQIDLHGLTILQSESAILSAVQECKRTGKRKLLIIHGKGNHSTDGKARLKTWLKEFLDRQPWAGPTGVPDRQQGASGATWVIIKGSNK